MATDERATNKRTPARETLPRTVCGCEACRAGCRTMPGSLAPGDIGRIAAATGADPTDETWLGEHFCVSTGMRIIQIALAGGQPQAIQIPTIVPQQRADGRCVFLDEAGHCMVHAVAPYGCSHFDTHQHPTASQERLFAHAADLMEAAGDPDHEHSRAIDALLAAKRLARPIHERKAAYAAAEAAAKAAALGK